MLPRYNENLDGPGVGGSLRGMSSWNKLRQRDLYERNKSSIGVVIRDGRGGVIASCLKLLQQAYSSREVEAMAAATALSFASDIGVQQAILKGDSLEVFKA